MSPLSRILDRYRNLLVPPPARGANVCTTCRRSTEGYERCWQCNQHFRHYGNQLAYVLATFLSRHETCWGVLDLVTVVPSSQGRTSPLVDALGRRITRTRGRFAELLVSRCENDRRMRPDCYEVLTEVEGRSVLLVDDTWTSGASLQSAAVALKRSGAVRVVGLVIGRHLDRPAPAAPAAFDWDTCVLCQQV
ncbi:phosphoribosyltransferase [Lentzea sp. NPDC042327]|uniref:phosphoribosyltransferase n=1 Tax=Lentzea sp. NPDC042327 TaxID=3154801 RepID=UPI0033CFE877